MAKVPFHFTRLDEYLFVGVCDEKYTEFRANFHHRSDSTIKEMGSMPVELGSVAPLLGVVQRMVALGAPADLVIAYNHAAADLGLPSAMDLIAPKDRIGPRLYCGDPVMKAIWEKRTGKTYAATVDPEEVLSKDEKEMGGHIFRDKYL